MPRSRSRSPAISLFLCFAVTFSAAQTRVASLHPGLVRQRTSPSRQNIAGPVLYQIIFRSSATVGAIPMIGPNHTLVNSNLMSVGGGVGIGGLVIDQAGVMSFAGSQTTFPGVPGGGTLTSGDWESC